MPQDGRAEGHGLSGLAGAGPDAEVGLNRPAIVGAGGDQGADAIGVGTHLLRCIFGASQRHRREVETSRAGGPGLTSTPTSMSAGLSPRGGQFDAFVWRLGMHANVGGKPAPNCRWKFRDRSTR